MVYMDLPLGKTVRLTDYSNQRLSWNGINNPKWSPDGRYILFLAPSISINSSQLDNDRPLMPWILDIKLKKVWSVGPEKDRWYLDAKWASDSHSILAKLVEGSKPSFALRDDVKFLMSGGQFRISRIDIKTGKGQVVWKDTQPRLWTVSPQLNYLLLYENIYEAEHPLYLMNYRNGYKRKLGSFSDVENTAFSPDGNKIALYRKGKLLVGNRNDKTLRSIYQAKSVYTHNLQLIWSPNRKWIALDLYTNYVHSYDPPLVSGDSQSLVVNSATGKVRDIKKSLGKEEVMVVGWTADSQYILLASSKSSTSKANHTILSACPLNGGPSITIIDIHENICGLDWHPF